MDRKPTRYALEVQLDKAESENGALRTENAELKERVAVLEASQYAPMRRSVQVTAGSGAPAVQPLTTWFNDLSAMPVRAVAFAEQRDSERRRSPVGATVEPVDETKPAPDPPAAPVDTRTLEID